MSGQACPRAGCKQQRERGARRASKGEGGAGCGGHPSSLEHQLQSSPPRPRGQSHRCAPQNCSEAWPPPSHSFGSSDFGMHGSQCRVPPLMHAGGAHNAGAKLWPKSGLGFIVLAPLFWTSSCVKLNWAAHVPWLIGDHGTEDTLLSGHEREPGSGPFASARMQV